MLLIYTLECLYALTSLGERACNRLSKVRGVYDTLVSLVTVEAQSYGPKACIGMKVVETVPPGTIPNIQPQQSLPQPTPSTTPTPSTSSTPPPSNKDLTSSVPLSSPNVATPIYTTSSSTPTPVTPMSRVVAINSSVSSTSSTFSPRSCSTVGNAVTQSPVVSQVPVLVSQQQSQPVVVQVANQQKIVQVGVNHNVHQQHAHQQTVQENEQFALAWLRANFEPDVNGRIEQQELYRNYLTSCSKIGRKGVIAPLHFPRCVR